MRALGRKKTIVVLVALMAAMAAWAWRSYDPAPLPAMRDVTFDFYQRLKPRIPIGQPIRIVTIDERSIAEFGQWPWPRTRIAALVDRLTALGVATIAFDMVFSEPDRTGPEGIIEQLREQQVPGGEAIEAALLALPKNDSVLAVAIGRAPVVLGYFNENDSQLGLPEIKAGFSFLGEDPKPVLPPIRASVKSLKVLEDPASGNGSISLTEQADDVVRRVPLFLTDGEKVFPSMVLEALRVVLGEQSYTLKTSYASGEFSGGRLEMTEFRIGSQISAPVDAEGRMIIYNAPNQPELYVSAADVLSLDEAALRPMFENHLVFVGASAAGLRDIRVTALGESVPGVYMHAQVADQILSGAFLNRPNWAKGVELAAMLLISIVTVAILPFAGALASALFGIAMAGLVLGASWYAFAAHGYLIDPLFPMLTGAAIYLLTTILLYAFTEQEKRFVRGAFQRYLAPDLLDKLEKNPESLKLGGEIRNMTLMFMDIRGFTPISERLNPQELVTFLNKLLSPLSEAILRHEGAIDKYIGDSIMAFWNAPLDVEDHPRKAARAALDMMAALKELNERDAFGFHRPEMGLGDVQIGIGLNTGEGCVGNMGSTNRFDYSVIGDTVNVAARIESTTKPAGWFILLSEATAASCPDFAVLKGGSMPLKGKSKPATLYALIGDERLASTSQWRELAGLHDRFLAACEQADAEAAREMSFRCMKTASVDLSAFYDALLQQLAAAPAKPAAEASENAPGIDPARAGLRKVNRLGRTTAAGPKRQSGRKSTGKA
jgi:adenylate cyclase